MKRAGGRNLNSSLSSSSRTGRRWIHSRQLRAFSEEAIAFHPTRKPATSRMKKFKLKLCKFRKSTTFCSRVISPRICRREPTSWPWEALAALQSCLEGRKGNLAPPKAHPDSNLRGFSERRCSPRLVRRGRVCWSITKSDGREWEKIRRRSAGTKPPRLIKYSKGVRRKKRIVKGSGRERRGTWRRRKRREMRDLSLLRAKSLRKSINSKLRALKTIEELCRNCSRDRRRKQLSKGQKVPPNIIICWERRKFCRLEEISAQYWLWIRGCRINKT